MINRTAIPQHIPIDATSCEPEMEPDDATTEYMLGQQEEEQDKPVDLVKSALKIPTGSIRSKSKESFAPPYLARSTDSDWYSGAKLTQSSNYLNLTRMSFSPINLPAINSVRADKKFISD